MDHTTKELEQTLAKMIASRSISYVARDYIVGLILKKIYAKGEKDAQEKKARS